MTDRYIDSAATPVSPFTSWATASNTLQPCLDVCVAGDTIYAISTDTETSTASVIYSSPGESINPVRIISATGIGNVYQEGYRLNTSPDISYDITFDGSFILYGVNLGSVKILGLQGGVGHRTVMYGGSAHSARASGTSGVVRITAQGATAYLEGVAFRFSGPGACIGLSGGGRMEVVDATMDPLSVTMDHIFLIDNTRAGCLMVRGGNFDLLSATGHLLHDGGFDGRETTMFAEGCLLPVGAKATGGSILGGTIMQAWGCGSTTQIQSFEYASAFGTANDSTAVYRVGGAEYNKTGSPYSMQVTPTTDSSYDQPVRVPLGRPRWLSANPVITAHLVYDSAVNLQNNQAWLEIEHPGVGSTVHRHLNVVSKMTLPTDTPTDLPASTETWIGSGGFANENKSRITVPIGAGAEGMHRVWLAYGPGAATPILYADPEWVVT